MNHKEVHRLYREEHLAVRRLKRKRLVRSTFPLAERSRANQEWSIDVVVDGLATGRALRALTVIDSHTRECVTIETDSCLSSRRLARALEWTLSGKVLGTGNHVATLPGLLRRKSHHAAAHCAGADDAKRTIEHWRIECNTERPNRSMCY